MSVCETCWTEATRRAYLRGGYTAQHYRNLLDEGWDGCPHAKARLAQHLLEER